MMMARYDNDGSFGKQQSRVQPEPEALGVGTPFFGAQQIIGGHGLQK